MRFLVLKLVLAGLLLAAVAACGESGDSASVQDLAEDGIVFASNRDDRFSSDIYVMSPDGSEVARLIDSDTWDLHPAWSPDRSRIAFLRLPLGEPLLGPLEGANRHEIWVWPIDGSGGVKIADLAAEWSPEWSPDGQRIGFNSDRDGASHFYLVNADGSNLTKLANSEGGPNRPAWSPDGNRLALDVLGGIDSVDLDSSDIRSLINNGNAGAPAWSPDGARIAFHQSGGNGIGVANADGSDLHNVGSGDARLPVWSPDGSRIAYESSGIIWVVDADGSGLAQVSSGGEGDPSFYYDLTPVWSVDGTMIAFGCRRGDFEICTVNADGSNELQITDNDATDMHVGWS